MRNYCTNKKKNFYLNNKSNTFVIKTWFLHSLNCMRTSRENRGHFSVCTWRSYSVIKGVIIVGFCFVFLGRCGNVLLAAVKQTHANDTLTHTIKQINCSSNQSRWILRRGVCKSTKKKKSRERECVCALRFSPGGILQRGPLSPENTPQIDEADI